ncbi:hypothetical protein HYDPIDRAFT_51067, partial [Hydnomerulius pinastri MD-312]
LLVQYNMLDAHPVSTPMDPGLRLTRKKSTPTEDERAYMDNTPYKNLVGSLNYIA